MTLTLLLLAVSKLLESARLLFNWITHEPDVSQRIRTASRKVSELIDIFLILNAVKRFWLTKPINGRDRDDVKCFQVINVTKE